MSKEVLKTYTEVATRVIGNPSSLHALGVVATRLLDASRRQISELLNVDQEEIYFTSGGTEGDNWVLKGVAFEKKKYGRHIIISEIEHPAVKNAAEWLSDQGFDIDYAPVNAEGFVKVDELARLLRDDTILVSIMAVNNEIGSIQPIREVSELLLDRPTITFHVDAVQAIGKVPVKKWLLPRVDFATLSAHKFHGPRGVGIVVAKSGKKITPLLHGGGQENNKRSTTENLAGIAATAKALRLTLEDDSISADRILKMKQIIYNELSTYPYAIFFSQMNHFVSNILTFGLQNIRGEVVVHAFEQHEIYVSTTSACSSTKNSAASTLLAMHVKPKLATSAVRISLDATNTMAEVEEFLTIFRQIYNDFERLY